MDNCWISCQVMADLKKVYNDLILINLYVDPIFMFPTFWFPDPYSFSHSAKTWRPTFCWFTCFEQVANTKLFLFWFTEVAEQFQTSKLYKIYKSTKNGFSNFSLIEEVWICLVFLFLYIFSKPFSNRSHWNPSF